MTTKTLTGTYTGGYTLSGAFSAVTASSSAHVTGAAGTSGVGYNGGPGGVGLTLPNPATATNQGTIIGGAGMHGEKAIYGGYSNYGGDGGAGGDGVLLQSSGTVSNSLTIVGGAGGFGGYGPVEGGVGGNGGDGVRLEGAGSVNNSGVILGGHGGEGGDHYSLYLSLNLGGVGGAGVVLGAYGTVTNLGQLAGGGGGFGGSGYYRASGDGVDLAAGGVVVNGSASNHTAFIGGNIGVKSTAAAADVANYGTIQGYGGTAVAFGVAGGEFIAFDGSQTVGLVTGGGGELQVAGGAETLTGLGATCVMTGSIGGSFTNFGLYVLDPGASWKLEGIETLGGKRLIDNGTVTIAPGADLYVASGSYAQLYGPVMSAGTMQVDGGGGISIYGAVTGYNAVSVIDSSVGCEVSLRDGASVQVQGVQVNSGTIALMSVSTATDLRVLVGGATLAGGGVVAMGGPRARILGVSAAATLTNVDNTISGTGVLGSKDMTLINQAAGVIEATGLLTVRDAAGHSLTNSGLIEANATGKLALVSETINQSGGGKILAAGGLVTLQGVDFIGGTLTTTGAGRINVDGGGAILDGGASAVRVNGLLQVTGGETLTVEGNVTNSGKLDLHAAKVIVGSVGVTLSGSGQINLNDNATNIIVGAVAATTLTNVNDRIAGSGNLGGGQMVIVNQAGGQIIGNQGVALTIDTGASTIANAGLIENSGAGGTKVLSAANNTGTLKAVTAGTLTLQGAVTGAGVAQINGGTLYVQQAFAENVTFTGTTGVLKLGDSQAYTGSITGLSKTGTNSLDLADIAFSNTKTKASYSGTSASGVLTVTDGTHTAKITLIGNYLGSTFTVSTDGHTGTKVVDPSAPAGPATLAQAMAGFQHDPPPHLAATSAYSLPRFPTFHAQA